MPNQFNIVIVMNSEGLDTACVANVHRLPLIQALADGIDGFGKILVVTHPVSLLTALFCDWICLLSFLSHPKMQRKKKGLFLFKPYVFLPISLAERWLITLKMYRRHLRWQFHRVMEKIGFSHDTPRVLWITHPFYRHYFGLFDEKMTIYDCYDDFVLFGKNRPDEQTRRAEVKLAGKCDLVLVTARTLFERLSQINQNTHYFPNAVDFGLFNRALHPATMVAGTIRDIRKPVIGFIGNISHHSFDYELVFDVAKRNPDWSFVFVGEEKPGRQDKVCSLKQIPNTHFLGWQDYYDLPSYLKGFDVAILPYKINENTRSINPNKLYQFMAAGVPIVSTSIPEAKQLEGVVEIGKGALGFEDAIKRALAKKGTETRLVATAATNSWDRRVSMLLRLIEDKLSAKKSVFA